MTRLLTGVIVVCAVVAATVDLCLPPGDPWLIGTLTVCFTAAVVCFAFLYRDARAWRHEELS